MRSEDHWGPQVSLTQDFTSTVAHKVLLLLEGQDRKEKVVLFPPPPWAQQRRWYGQMDGWIVMLLSPLCYHCFPHSQAFTYRILFFPRANNSHEKNNCFKCDKATFYFSIKVDFLQTSNRICLQLQHQHQWLPSSLSVWVISQMRLMLWK